MKSFYLLLIPLFACTKAKTALPVDTTQTTTTCSVPDPTSLSYSTHIATLMQNYCFPCHASPGSGGINLDNYNDVKAQAQSGDLLSVIIGGPQQITMPPPPKKQLDSCEIKVIDLWIQRGCK